MAYTKANLVLVSRAPLTGGGQIWMHHSADTGATVDTTGFITDGGDRGMKVNDILYHRNDTSGDGTGITSTHMVVTVSSTAPGAVDLTDTTTMVSGTNTD